MGKNNLADELLKFLVFLSLWDIMQQHFLYYVCDTTEDVFLC
jgi:hypothetical protein